MAIFVFVLPFFIFSCTPSSIGGAPISAPIQLGALFPLTGGLSQYGQAASNAAVLAVEDINNHGGLDGRKLIIDIQDHQCSPKIAVSLFEQMVEAKGIHLFTSAACSGTVLAIAPLLGPKQALLLGTIVTTPTISGVSPFVFRNWASDATQAELYAREIRLRGLKTVGVIYEQTDYAQGLFLSLKKYLEGSGVTLIGFGFEPGTTDVRTHLSKLQQEKPDSLFISPQTVTSGDIVLKQLEESGWKPSVLFVNDNILKSPDLLTRYTTTLQGAFSGEYTIKHSETHDTILDRYRNRYGKECPQTNICVSVYDAIHLLAKAAGKNESHAFVSSYLSNIQYSGASGQVSFDKNHDRKGATYTLYIIQNGKGNPATIQNSP